MPTRKAKLATHPPADGNVSAVARQYNVARGTVMRWRDQGLDLADADAVAAKVAASKAAAPTEDEKAAKLRKLQAEADMIEHKLAVQRGEYIRADEVKSEGVRIGLAVSTVFAKMPDELPPLLTGHDSAKIKKILTNWQREKRTELSLHEGPVKITN